MRRLRPVASVLTTVVLLTAAGCAGARPGDRSRGTTGFDQPPRVAVENESWQEMAIYVETSSEMRWRIGTVGTGETRVFVLRSAPDNFRLIGDPIGGRQLQYTELLVVPYGATAYWRIGNSPATSAIFMRW
jgi:hypothetical protein